MAGWLILASTVSAQMNQPSGARPTTKVKTLSPYNATASIIDMSGGEASDLPEMPTVVVPRMPVGLTMSRQPPATTPPVTPTAPPAPGQGSIAMPSGPGGATMAPSVPGMGGSCGQQSYGPCGQSCCEPCEPCGSCGPQGRMWFGGEYLLWTTSGMNVPPLVSAAPLGTPRDVAGIIGDPRTAVLFGGRDINDDFRSGVRLYSGMWLDECNTLGIDGSTFYLEPANDKGAFVCMTNAMIFARPFQDVNPNNIRSNAELVCYPGVLSGGVFVNTQSTLWGTDFNARKNMACGPDYRLDVLGGYRYMQLTDQVVISEQLAAADPNANTPVGTGFNVFDSFYSKNTFNGGQIGLAGEVRRGRFFASARTLVAIGGVHKEIEIFGSTTIAVPGQIPQQFLGGLLAQPTNIGKYTADEFAVLPEATVSIGYNVTDGIRAYVGYTFLYLSNTSRAGNQIDPVMNSTQLAPGTLVGTPRPIFVRQDSDFWAQGINFGLEIRF
jgi:Putative beta barrel porin-7 (BBP7)